MRIGLVLPNVPAYSETFFRNKIIGLQESGHEVVLFVGGKKSKKREELCPVFCAPDYGSSKIKTFFNSVLEILKTIFVNPKRSLKLYSLERKDGRGLISSLKNIISNQHILSQKLDFLHFGFGTVAIGREHLAEAMEAKMAVSFRGFDYYVYPLKNKNCYKLLFSKRVKYHVLSEGMKVGLIYNGINDDLIFKITPAINSEIFEPSENRKNGELQIFTVARLHWIKGLEYTLEAFALLKQRGIAFHYTIIGDGPEKERLIFAAYQLGILENITFAGKKSHEEVKLELQKATFYVQYSLQEGFCNAVLEAQAMGLLCVVSNAEGLAENVLDNETGWVVPKRNPAALADKMEMVIALPEIEKEAVRSKAIQRVREGFNLEKQQQEFLAFYGIKNK